MWHGAYEGFKAEQCKLKPGGGRGDGPEACKQAKGHGGPHGDDTLDQTMVKAFDLEKAVAAHINMVRYAQRMYHRLDEAPDHILEAIYELRSQINYLTTRCIPHWEIDCGRCAIVDSKKYFGREEE
jgi:hypothetical protein